jgi:predicted RNA-binding Zn ribbon-like protein
VEDLVNTRSVEDGADQLADPAAVAAWLLARGLVAEGVEVSEAEAALVRQAREGLRALIAANNAGPGDGDDDSPVDGVEPGALATLAALAPGLALVLDVGATPPRLAPREPGTVAGAMAALLADVAAAVADGTWARMKACREPTCRWAYYDHSRNRSRAWCSMAVCGNRAKARAFRRRGR